MRAKAQHRPPSPSRRWLFASSGRSFRVELGLSALVLIVAIVALVFLQQEPSSTDGEEQLNIGKQGHEHVVAGDTTDCDAEDFEDLLFVHCVKR